MALNLLMELSKYVTADIILDRILPYMVRNSLYVWFYIKLEFCPSASPVGVVPSCFQSGSHKQHHWSIVDRALKPWLKQIKQFDLKKIISCIFWEKNYFTCWYLNSQTREMNPLMPEYLQNPMPPIPVFSNHDFLAHLSKSRSHHDVCVGVGIGVRVSVG